MANKKSKAKTTRRRVVSKAAKKEQKKAVKAVVKAVKKTVVPVKKSTSTTSSNASKKSSIQKRGTVVLASRATGKQKSQSDNVQQRQQAKVALANLRKTLSGENNKNLGNTTNKKGTTKRGSVTPVPRQKQPNTYSKEAAKNSPFKTYTANKEQKKALDGGAKVLTEYETSDKYLVSPDGFILKNNAAKKRLNESKNNAAINSRKPSKDNPVASKDELIKHMSSVAPITHEKVESGKKVVQGGLSNSEAQQLQNAVSFHDPTMANRALSDNTKKKVANLTTGAYANAPRTQAFLQGRGLIDTENYIRTLTGKLDSKGNVKKSRLDEHTIASAKETKGYGAMEMLGTMSAFLPAGGAGAAIGKGIVKTAGKSLAKDTAKRVVATSLADAATGSPLNFIDALKQNVDSKGNINWEGTGMSMVLNTTMDMLFGGAVEGGAGVIKKIISKNDLKKINTIKTKLDKGWKITQEEYDFVQKKSAETKVEYIKEAENKAVEEVRAKSKAPTESKAPTKAPTKAPEEVKAPEEAQNGAKTSDSKAVKTTEVKQQPTQAVKVAENEDLKPLTLSRASDEVKAIDTVSKSDAENLKSVIRNSGYDENAVFKAKDVDGYGNVTKDTYNDIVDTIEELNSHKTMLSESAEGSRKYKYAERKITELENKLVNPMKTGEVPSKVPKEDIGQFVDEKAVKSRVISMKANGKSDEEIMEKMRELGVKDYVAEKHIFGKDDEWVANAKKAYEQALIDDEIRALKKEKQGLEIANNRSANKENPTAGNYENRIKRIDEINDRLDELYEQSEKVDIVNPSKEVMENADDLESAAIGKYVDDMEDVTAETTKTIDSFMRLMVDSFRGFEKYADSLPKAIRKTLKSQVNAVRNASNKAAGWITVKRVTADGEMKDSLNDILGDMLKPKNVTKYDDFQYYCANKHNIDRYREGKGVFGNKIDDKESAKICDYLEEKYPDFKQTQEKITDYLKDLQGYRIDAGLVSRSSGDYLDAMYPNYIPTYRIVDNKKVSVKGHPNVANPIKEAIGSSKPLVPLHEQITNLTEYTMKLGEKNRLFNMVASSQGVSLKGVDKTITLDEAVQASTFAIKDGDRHVVTFYDNGVPRHVNVTDQMYRGVKEWFNDTESVTDMFNWKAKGIKGANRMFKNLITGWNPIFGVKNIVRDTAEALIYSKDTFAFIRSYPKAISAIVNKNGKYADYFTMYQSYGGKYAQLRDVVTKFDTDSIGMKVVKSPITVCQKFNDCLEAVPRMSEFIATVEKSSGVKGGAKEVLQSTSTKKLTEAMYNANEVTLNFGRGGQTGKMLNGTVLPYFNPAIQGLDKLVRVFKEGGSDGVKGFFSLTTKMGAFAVAPAIFNEVMMTLFGGEAYQNLNTRDKDNNFFFPLGDEKFMKIPKSRVGAALSTPFTHAYRTAVYGDEMGWTEMFKSMWSNVGVMNPFTNNLFSPLVAVVFTNKTWYGGSIENAHDLDLRATGQNSKIFDDTTSGIAIWLGDKLNMSPKKIDYLIDGYTGVVGDFLLPMTVKSSKGNPLYKNFILDSVFSNKTQTDFWDKNATMEANARVKGGKAKENYEKWKNEYMYDALTISKAMEDINGNDKLSAKEKAEKRRELKKLLNQIQRNATDGTKCNIEPVNAIAKIMGANYALSNYLPTAEDKTYSYQEHYKVYKKAEGYKNATKEEKKEIAKDFLKTYTLAVNTQKAISVTYHSTPDWTVLAVANAQRKGRDSIAKSCGVYDDDINEAKTYVAYGGNTKRLVATMRRVNKVVETVSSNGIDTKDNLYKYALKGGVTALGLANSKAIVYKDLAYYITGSDTKMNAARGLGSKYKWTTTQLAKLGLACDSDGNKYLKKSEVINAINNSKAKTSEEKAMLYVLIYGTKGSNPFGSIGDYSIVGDTGITSTRISSPSGSSGGYGRSKSTKEKTVKEKAHKMPSWEDYVKDYISNTEKAIGLSYKDWDSPMDAAYRKKIQSIIKKGVDKS